MLPDIGDGADGGLGPLALEAVVFPVGGDPVQHAEVGGKQQGAVVQQPPLCHPLGAAGDLSAADGNVTGPVFPGRNADVVQRRQDRSQALVVVYRGPAVGNVCIVQIPKVVVYRAAAGDAPDHRDPQLPQTLHVNLPADVLITAHDHGGVVLPQQEYLTLAEMLEHILLKRLVVKRVVGGIQHRQHSGTSFQRCVDMAFSFYRTLSLMSIV